MRTKTAILSAAALAAGLLSASAQVYSANVVGYYNITAVPLRNVLISDQLPGSGTNTMLNNELVHFADMEAADGNQLLIWNGVSLDTYIFFPPSAGGPAWVDSNGDITTVSLGLGKSAYLQNVHGTAQTLTVVGEVKQGSTTNVVLGSASGSTFLALPFPVSTNLDSTIANLNAASVSGDTLLKWNPLSHAVGFYDDSYTFFDASEGGPAWVDSNGDIAVVKFNVGEGFLYGRNVPGNVNWVRSFTVQ